MQLGNNNENLLVKGSIFTNNVAQVVSSSFKKKKFNFVSREKRCVH